MGKREGSESEL